MKTKQTTCITRLLGLLLLATGLSTGACTSEMTDHEVTPPTEVDTGRREVLLTFKNKLSLPGGATRGLATAEENELSTLDVYVFGSETETGTYTFQERFAYRADGYGPLPYRAQQLPLAVDQDDDSKTTGLLGLQKGLYVKLYCIANDTTLVNPTTGIALKAKEFKALKLNESISGATLTVQTPGVPTESDFLSHHTPLLTPTQATDVLTTPLAMSGAYTTPIDLTDPASASRLNIGFKLTRMVTRFDVVNNAAESRFTIKSISMGKGRRGATFFPIAVCDAQASLSPDKLITYPERPFDGAQANQGFQSGAFYSYASPQADGGYLILKGDYQVNATEQKEVTYQVPFRQLGPDGQEAYIDINHNHRYTIGITKADEYHLDFTLKVEDWADDGSVDNYVPENKPGEITLGNKDAETEYELDAVSKKHTVKMSLVAGANFEAKIAATAMLQVTKTYAGGIDAQQYDWFTIIKPVSTFAASQSAQVEYTYNFELTTGYAKGRFPRATIRFFDPISGSESILYVEAISAPTPVETQQPSKAPNGSSPNPNGVDLDNLEVSLYRITDSRADVTITCADEVELESSPTWLTVTKTATQQPPKTTYSIVLNDRDVVETTGKVVFHNVNKQNLKTEYTVNLLDAPIQPKFESVGTSNSFKPDAGTGATLGDLVMNVAPGNKAAVITTPMDGVTTKIDFDGGPEWLKSDAAAAATTTRAVAAQQQTVTFSLQEGKLAGAKTATVTLINKIGGKDEVFTISPKLNVGTIEKVSSIPTNNTLSGANILLYKMPTGTSEMKLKVTSYGGSTLTTNNDNVTVTKTATTTRVSNVTQDEVVSYYTLTPKTVGSTQLTLANRTDPTQQKTYTVQVKSTAITHGSTTVAAGINTTNSIQITSPEGCSVAITSWGTSSKNWFSISNTTLAAGTQTLTIKQLDNSQTIMKPVTLQLTNKIVGGESKTITITPTFSAPTFSKSNIVLENIKVSYSNSSLSGTHQTFSYVAAPGGWEYYTQTDFSVADVSEHTTYCYVYGKKKGETTLYFRNKSDKSKIASVSVRVARSFAGKPVYEINGYYIAGVDAGTTNWHDLKHSICNAGADGDGGNTTGGSPNKYKWFIPFNPDLKAILGTSSDLEHASASIYNFLVKDNNLFPNKYCWTYDSYQGSSTHGYILLTDGISVIRGSSSEKGNNLPARCVMKR